MSKEEIELTASCGFYCGDCLRFRSKAADLARGLLSELRDTRFDQYARIKTSSAKQFNPVKQFEHYGECCEVLETIVALQCNSPCQISGGCPTFTCDILECCREKGFKGCWECDEIESCTKFVPLEAMHGDAPKQNLRKIKELGLDKWAESRSKPYVWL